MARHEGRVVFVRYALPEERVRVRVVADHGSYWHADVVEVLEASPDRVDSLCPIAGVDGAGCCDLAFAAPGRRPSTQGRRRRQPAGEARRISTGATSPTRSPNPSAAARPPAGVPGSGWTPPTTGVPDSTATTARSSSPTFACGQLPQAALDGLSDNGWPPGAHLHVALDDDGARHVVQSGPRVGRRTTTRVVEGGYEATQRVNGRVWRVPVTAFWQAHRDAARVYSESGRRMGAAARRDGGMGSVRRRRGFRRGAGRGRRRERTGAERRHVARRVAFGAGRAGGPGQRLGGHRFGAPCPWRPSHDAPTWRCWTRRGPAPGREVIDLLAAAEVPRIIHIGCEAASFARDIGLYLAHGYRVEDLRVFDSFPLTHHIESVAVLTR